MPNLFIVKTPVTNVKGKAKDLFFLVVSNGDKEERIRIAHSAVVRLMTDYGLSVK